MTGTIIDFSNLEVTALLIAILVLAIRLLSFVMQIFDNKEYSQYEYLSSNQPYIAAGIIIATYVITNSFGLTLFSLNKLIVDQDLIGIINHCVELVRFGLVIWLIYAELKILYIWLENSALFLGNFRLLMLTIKNSFKFCLFTFLLPLLLPSFQFFPGLEKIVHVVLNISIIWSVAWVIIQCTDAAEKIYVNKRSVLNLTDYHARGIITQTRIFKKIASFIIILMALAATCLIFESVRTVGASILASAGIATGILGFAANKIIGNFFVGLQIAVTQPIKINDAISVEGEFGIIEDISLNYVVLKIWDMRRLILPINYFIEKPFQNFSRNSTDIISQIVFFADYTLPVSKLREFFNKVVAESSYWDGNIVNLQVTDVQDRILKLRGIASVRNPGDSWNLRCEVLEKMIAFIVSNYPESLPKFRFENNSADMEAE